MGSKRSDGSNVVGGIIVGIVVLIAMIPKEVWIFLGVIAGAALITWIVVAIVKAETKRREEAAAAAEREREERIRKAKLQRVAALGKENAAQVEAALKAVGQVAASEAARAGWLGDVDFTPDVRGINEAFRKAHDLRRVTTKLSGLSKPTDDDRRILAEARTTVAQLERAALERVELIKLCAKEAQGIDDSLRTEREDARVAEQRAELHAKLSAMLYGIEASPDTTSRDSAVDAVMARVQAYREIKNQIDLARDGETA